MTHEARKPMTLKLPATTAAAAQARDALAGVGGCDADTSERLALLTSELVTNAVRHGGERIVVSASFEAPAIRVEVRDYGSGFDRDAALAPTATATGGFGLKIVDRLADRWGNAPQCGMVWFELDA